MIRISLSPVRMDEKPPSVSVQGYALTVGGEVFDFSPLPDGHKIPATAISSRWFSGEVIRDGEVLHLRLLLPYGLNPSEAVVFPKDIEVEEDGEVELPYDAPVEPPPQVPVQEL